MQQQQQLRRPDGSQDTLDDSSSDLAEPPYRSLSSSCELHRYGTLNSLPDGLAAEEEHSAHHSAQDLTYQDEPAQDDEEDQDDRTSGQYTANIRIRVTQNLTKHLFCN